MKLYAVTQGFKRDEKVLKSFTNREDAVKYIKNHQPDNSDFPSHHSRKMKIVQFNI